MASYLINGWDGEIPKKDLQGYLDRGELYDDCWAMALPDDGKGWQMVRDILAAQLGAKVEGLYGDGTWYPGTLQGTNADGSYLVVFDGFEGAETCESVRAVGGGAADTTTTPAAAAAAAAAAPDTAAAAADPKVWHVLGADGVNTDGPYSVAGLQALLASASIDSETYMIHETGADWVTVGSKATAAAAAAVSTSASAPAPAPATAITPLAPAPEPTSEGSSAKQFAAAQTRKRHHARKKTEVTVFAAVVPSQERKHERKRSQRKMSGSRSRPVKSGNTSYRKNDKDSFDAVAAMQICQWMEMILDREIAPNAEDFKTYLMTETQVLCELFNTFKPDSTRKAKKSRMRFKQQENIGHFFRACKGLLDMEEVTLFSANECLDGKNMNRVLQTIVEFAKRMRAEFPPDDAPPALEVTFQRRKVGRF
jgi:hypothetical protein